MLCVTFTRISPPANFNFHKRNIIFKMPLLGSEYHHLGDVIYQGEPFVKVISQDLWDKCCANCYVSLAILKKCGACRIMKYCGQSCQRKAWPDHKSECPYLQNCKNFRHQTWVQMVGNTILKINGRDWKTVTERLMDKEVSFADLTTCTKIGPEVLESIKDDVVKYIGKDNLPNEEVLLEIIGKVYYNSFNFSPQKVKYGLYDCRALFIGGSKLDHSCVPNTTCYFNGKVLVVRASKVIHNSEKITIKHTPMITGLYISLLNINQMDIKKCFLERCYCSDCSEPFGKSPLTSIIDESKGISVLQETEATLQSIALLEQLNYPVGIVTRAKLSHLLEKQEGVLGKTNLRRMRTLATSVRVRNETEEEIKKELLELIDVMKVVWGEYFEELIPIYQKLCAISIAQNNLQDISLYSEKIAQLTKVCYGLTADIAFEQLEHFMRAFHPLNFFLRR